MACHLAPKHSLNPLEYECLRKLTSLMPTRRKEIKKEKEKRIKEKGGKEKREGKERDLEMIQTRNKGCVYNLISFN